jgi:hypothetical protein
MKTNFLPNLQRDIPGWDDGLQHAAPRTQQACVGSDRTSSGSYTLTKREYFAGLALQGILAAQTEKMANGLPFDESDYGHDSKVAVKMADALIEELNKK